MVPPNLNIDTISIVAQQRHYEQSLRDGGRCLADPADVGRHAARLARHYYGATMPGMVAAHVELARCAGLLVYAIDRWGYNVDDVTQLAEHRVAEVVAGLSWDPRLAQGRRVQYHASTLGEASPLSQLVKLAEIVSVSRAIIDGFSDEDLVENADSIAQVVDGNAALLAALRHLVDDPRTRLVVAEARTQLVTIAARVEAAKADRKAARRAARLAASGALDMPVVAESA